MTVLSTGWIRRVCQYSAWAVCLCGGTVAASEQRLLQTIDDIPIHQIEVATVANRDAGITVDGRVDEPKWLSTPAFDNMIVAVPGTGEIAGYRTHTRILATDVGLYVSAVMEQPPGTLVARMSTRDDFIDRDTLGFTLDPSGEGLFAYWFILALGDSVQDGKVLPERNYQRDWDGPWIGRTAVRDDGWSAEMFLPWSMMNMPRTEGKRKIGFAVSRQVSHRNERFQWPGHPYASRQFVTALNAMEVDGVQPRAQLSIIPYASMTVDQTPHDDETRVGADLSWKPSPSLELTASILPDFGAVEADDVVLNLTALETFFPEKRLFFLEGNEVFVTSPRAGTGNALRFITNENFATSSRRIFVNTFVPPPISLMNSRRIGGTANQVTIDTGVSAERGETNLPTELLGAAKATGSVGNLRYGVMGAFEDDVEWLGRNTLGQRVDIDDDGRDFGVARFLYEDVRDSRRSIGYLGTQVSGPLYDATVHGLDAHYARGDGRLTSDLQLVRSDVDGVSGNGGLVDFYYQTSPSIQHIVQLDYMDEKVNFNDLGFLVRNDYAAAQYIFLYNNVRGTTHIKDIRGTIVLRQQYNISEGQLVDSGIFWRNSMVLPGRNKLRTAVGYLPKRFEDTDSRGNGAYETENRWWLDVVLATDSAKVLSYSAGIGAIQENLGGWTHNASVGLTYRPTSKVAVDLDVRYKDRNGWLVYQGDRNFGSYRATDWQPSVKMTWFLNARHQLRLSAQWAGVRASEDGFFAVPLGDGKLQPSARTLPDHDFTVSLFTMQMRYRWEIAPLTDFFFVYNRGSSLPNQIDGDFKDLFRDGYHDPIVNSFVMKLRYRFGN